MTAELDHPWADAETAIDVITGWRLWQVVSEGRSQHRLAAWSSRELVWPARARLEGHCLVVGASGHLAPQPRCRCGLYAFRTRSAAEHALTHEMRPTAVALGRVSLWGRVVAHADGWRGQFGYPYELLLAGTATASVAAELRAAYAVDVGLIDVPDLFQRVRAERMRAYGERMGRPLAA